jgi:hypothetical protein
MAATTTQENEADQVLYWFEKGVTELQIMRNGGPKGSQPTALSIFFFHSAFVK